jgi:hypothetical protein
MNEISEFYNDLGQEYFPYLADRMFSDLLTITAETPVSDGGGGFSSSATTNAYTNIPCAYEPLSGSRFDTNGKLLSVNAYRVTIPTHYDNAGTMTRINLNPATHRLVVASRGNEPAKVFRIVSVGDEMGIVFEVTCEKEN